MDIPRYVWWIINHLVKQWRVSNCEILIKPFIKEILAVSFHHVCFSLKILFCIMTCGSTQAKVSLRRENKQDDCSRLIWEWIMTRYLLSDNRYPGLTMCELAGNNESYLAAGCTFTLCLRTEQLSMVERYGTFFLKMSWTIFWKCPG